MSDDYYDHPIVRDLKSYAADPKDAEFDTIVTSFAGMHDGFRAEMLNKLKGWTSADDGASLRQRAQLVNLSRQLNNVHQNLRRAGR